MNCISVLCLFGSLILPVDTPIDGALSKELQRFQGSWQATSIQSNDDPPASVDDLKHTLLVVAGDRFTLKGKEFTIAGKLTIDPAKTPKTIDVVLDGKEGEKPVKLLGIYRIDGETRRSCFAMPEKERPAAFPVSPKGYIQFEWKPLAR